MKKSVIFKLNKMEKFNKQSKFNESIYELLENSFQNETQECIIDEIIRNTKFSDIEKVLEILVSQKMYDEKRIKKLKGDVDKAEHKYCMPEGINSKEEHEQYLQAIGYDNYLNELKEIYCDIPDSKDCKTIVEAYLVEKLYKIKNILDR